MHAFESAKHGLLLRDMAIELLGKRGFDHEVEEGRLIRERSRVYAVAGAPSTRRRDLLAAAWAARGHASHRSTLWLCGLRQPPPRPEIIVPRGNEVRLDGVRIHRSNFLPPHHLTVVDNIPTTIPARAAVDASAVMGDDRLGPLLDEGERLRLWTYAEVHQVFLELQARGRRRIAHLRPILEERLDGFTPGDSDFEVVVRTWIVEDGLPEPVSQLWVVTQQGRFCLDLAYPPPFKIAIEPDGWDSHRGRGRFSSDRSKIRALELAGWLVLPYSSDIPRYVVVREVRDALRQRGGI